MAKIENTTAYPTVTPAADDYIIGTDVSNDNETVTFLVSDLTGASGINQGLQSVLSTGNTASGSILLTGNINLLGGPGVGYLDLCQIKLGGSFGIAGQVLTSQGPGSCATWETPSATSCCNLQGTMSAGNTTSVDLNTTGSINMAGSSKTLALSNSTDMTLASGSTITTDDNIFLGATSVLNFDATSAISDYSGSTGTAGQVLTVNAAGTGIEWSSSLPTPPTPTLQDVLTKGNVATAVGINLTATSPLNLDSTSSIVSAGANTFSGNNTFSGSGNIQSTAGIALTGTVWAGASVGTSGQVLTSTGTGVQWSSSAGVSTVDLLGPTASTGLPLTISPTSGDVKIRPHTYNGGSDVGYVPAGGTAGTFLQGDGSWGTATGTQDLASVLTQGNTAANSIELTGVSNSIKAYKGIFASIQEYSSGSTGAAGEVLTANGSGGWTWQPASGAGVASVTAITPGTSSGTPIVITPTSGAVTVKSMAFDGTSKVGHVPDSSAASQTTAFLRADGTWQVPATSTTIDTFVHNVDVCQSGALIKPDGATGDIFTLPGIDDANFFSEPTRIVNGLLGSPSATFPPSEIDRQAGFIFINPHTGSCDPSVDVVTPCSIDINMVTDFTGQYTFYLRVADPCDPANTTFTNISTSVISGEANQISCFSVTPDEGGFPSIPAGHGIYFYYTPPAGENPINMKAKISIQMVTS